VNDWLLQSGVQAIVLLVAVVGSWWHLKSDIRSLRESQTVMRENISEIKDGIRGSGYMSKADIDRLLTDAISTHTRQEAYIEDLRRNKLFVQDYEREHKQLIDRIERLERRSDPR